MHVTYRAATQNVFASRLKGHPLFSFWTHFPDRDMDADSLAEATIALQQTFDLDLVKTAPNGMYAIEDYGVEVDYSQVSQGGTARLVTTPYQSAADWDALPELDCLQGALARELRSMTQVRRALPDVPLVFTLFSPMTIAAKLSHGRIHGQIAEKRNTQGIHAALQRISRTVARYAQSAIAAGADGVFFAHQDTGRHLLSYDDFSEYVAPYDIEALAGARDGRFNVLHIHGENIRFRELQDYPVDAINWHDSETFPSALSGMLTSGKCILGGIDRRSVTANDVPAIRQQIRSNHAAVGGRGDIIFAPSCTIRAGFKPQTLHAIRDEIRASHGTPSAHDAGQPAALAAAL
ncbi:uroporphyrinogen decarboxylase family protein [Bordetella trematum]|uniref:uroporphyrinogen decarboxylase family protein n=1 Tax=Bordetella trematum TaxID=123899 RepID=UPI003989405C